MVITLQHYDLKLADLTLSCAFSSPRTAEYFGRWCSGPFPGEADLTVPDWLWTDVLPLLDPQDPRNEYSVFSIVCSAALLAHEKCIFHAAALRRRDRAYLLCGPSGVGKTTQLRTLQSLYPGEFDVISGDRPILERLPGGGIMVHPSPWNGKEDLAGAAAAPLAGVVLLTRAAESAVQPLSSKEAAAPLFKCFFTAADSSEELQQIADFETAVLKAAPCWQLACGSIDSAARLLYHTILEGGEQNGIQTERRD